MRTQHILVVAAASVAGLAFLGVGTAVMWPHLTGRQVAPRPAMQIAQINNGPIVAAQPDRQVAKQELPKLRGKTVPTQELTVAAPQTHDNLTVFLIHGRDADNKAKVLTLQEALERNLATVHETGAGRLMVDNRSNTPLLIQAGDIVKGGTQDRTLPYDMLIAPKSQRTPVVALCVEKGRSFPRRGEISTSFSTSTQRLPGKDLRLAALRRSQGTVWNGVSDLQNNLARNSGGSVQAPLSRTSLQLSLEHHRVAGAVEDYLAKLDPAAKGKKDVVGYVCVINGEIQSADLYASSDLFQRMWPKLIRASAVAALASKRDGAFAAPNADAVKQFLADNDQGVSHVVNTGNASHVIRHESNLQVRLDTCDRTRGNAVLHRTILAK